jgi:hypothetical protein
MSKTESKRRQSVGAILKAAVLVVLGLCLLTSTVLAQDYSFSVPSNRVDVYVEEDGTVRLVYDLTFVPDPGSHPIDVVDVGMPNSSFQVSDVQASIDGVSLPGISESPYVKPGVAVELGPYAIQPGESGTLHLEATGRDLVFQDSKDQNYASFEFSPTWFDSQFVHGPTRLEVNVHLPPGVTAEEPRYHDVPFTSAGFQDDRVVYTWIKEDARADQSYPFGVSFPKTYVAEGVIQKPPAFNLNFGAICSSPICWLALIGGGWAFFAFVGSLTQKKRKMEYLPPALAVEGAGIKRGLTAVEAAVLLEAPLNKVLAMILFGLVKKGILTVETDKPLRVKVQKPLLLKQAAPQEQADPPEQAASAGEAGSASGSEKLWYYERSFLKAVQPDGSLVEKDLRAMAIDLIGDVNKKLTGFSRAETKEYYKDIAARAWKQVEAADTPEVLGERWSDGLEWTMLDDNWDDHTRRVFQDRPVVLPNWWWGYRPWAAPAGGSAMPSAPRPSAAPGGGGTPVTLPTLPGAEFANTVVGGIEKAANTVVSSVEGFTGQVVQKTNPPPKPSSSHSGSSSRGYSCACACACAGCACACAGGGR